MVPSRKESKLAPTNAHYYLQALTQPVAWWTVSNIYISDLTNTFMWDV